MKHLYPYLRRFRKESILAPLFKMLEATFDLLVPMVVADIIKVGIAGGDTTYIWTRCGLLVLMALIGLLCSFTAQYFAARAAIGTSTGLRQLIRHPFPIQFNLYSANGIIIQHIAEVTASQHWQQPEEQPENHMPCIFHTTHLPDVRSHTKEIFAFVGPIK